MSTATSNQMDATAATELLSGLQEVAFEGCGYCLIAPEDRDAVLHLITAAPETAAENAHLRSANAALAEALAKLVAQFEDMDENMPTNAGCIECTAGTVPDNRNTGLCGYHAAKKLLATTQAKAQEGAG